LFDKLAACRTSGSPTIAGRAGHLNSRDVPISDNNLHLLLIELLVRPNGFPVGLMLDSKRAGRRFSYSELPTELVLRVRNFNVAPVGAAATSLAPPELPRRHRRKGAAAKAAVG
jgi:hypothetical protein